MCPSLMVLMKMAASVTVTTLAFFNGTSWRLVSLFNVFGGRRCRFKKDGSSLSFLDISSSFIVLVGSSCFCLPTRWEAGGLDFGSHLWWFWSPSGNIVIRFVGVWHSDASDSSQHGVAMAKSHLLKLGRSTCIKQINFDVLLKMATKIHVPLPERTLASSYMLRLLVARKTARISLQGSVCNFLFFQWYLCKHWDVTTKNHIWNISLRKKKQGVAYPPMECMMGWWPICWGMSYAWIQSIPIL